MKASTKRSSPKKSIRSPRKAREFEVGSAQWRPALVCEGLLTHDVGLATLTSDHSTLAGRRGSSLTKLWKVEVGIQHQQSAPSAYSTRPRSEFGDPSDSAFVTITIGCPRGEIGVPGGGDKGKGFSAPVETVIRCELGHIDALVLALANALIVGRRDKTFPVVRGMKPFDSAFLLRREKQGNSLP